MSLIACLGACAPIGPKSLSQKKASGATTRHVPLSSSIAEPALTPAPATPIARAADTAARTYYVGYRGSEQVQLWLAATSAAAFEGEIRGLSANAMQVRVAYKAPLDNGEWAATGMAEYAGELKGIPFESGFVFVIWRGPSEEVTELPNVPPEYMTASSGAHAIWLGKVGDEKAFLRHQELRQKLIDASGRHATTCGLRLSIQRVVEAQGIFGAVAYYLADPCARSGAAPSASYRANEDFFVAALDAEGPVAHAISLGKPTFDEESATLVRLELSRQAFFGVRRNWAKRSGGRAAATSDGWLLSLDGRKRLRIAANLGHWDINVRGTPSNDVANIYVADIDANPPDELILERGGVTSVYHAQEGTGKLVRVPIKLPQDSGELLKKSIVPWPD